MKCAIKTCKASNLRKNASSILPTFHRIPKDPALRRAWLNAIDRKDAFSANAAIVCSCHFTPDCYINSLLEIRSKKLKKGSIPTLYLDHEETTWDGEHVLVRNYVCMDSTISGRKKSQNVHSATSNNLGLRKFVKIFLAQIQLKIVLTHWLDPEESIDI